MLPNSADVEEVLMGPGGVLARLRPGGAVMDMSTVDPLLTDRIAAAAAEKGIAFVDAPVGRLAAHAERGESLFMVGATAEAFARVKPLLEAMGTTIHHCGGAGTGMRTKLVNNYLAIVSCAFNAEALALSQRFGLSLEKTLDVVHGTTATNGQLKIAWAAKVLKGDTEPGFTIDLAHKDLTLIVDAARASRSPCRSAPPPWNRSVRRERTARVRRIFPRWSTSCATSLTSIDHGFHEDEMAGLVTGHRVPSATPPADACAATHPVAPSGAPPRRRPRRRR